jgi:hypothetical protein
MSFLLHSAGSCASRRARPASNKSDRAAELLRMCTRRSSRISCFRRRSSVSAHASTKMGRSYSKCGYPRIRFLPFPFPLLSLLPQLGLLGIYGHGAGANYLIFGNVSRFLDAKDSTSLEYKLDSFSSVYRRLTGKDVVFEFPVQAAQE